MEHAVSLNKQANIFERLERTAREQNELVRKAMEGIGAKHLEADRQSIAKLMEQADLPKNLNRLQAEAGRYLTRSLGGPTAIHGAIKESLERTGILALGIDKSLSEIRIPSWETDLDRQLPTIRIPPNPIHKTNDHLSELTVAMGQLIDVSRQQAELTQAIRTTADLALQNALQSGEDAKTATLLARTSVNLAWIAIAVAILIACVGIYANYMLSESTDVRMKEEIQLLRDISGRLRSSSQPAIIPKR